MSRKLISVQISSALFLELANYLQEYGDGRDPSEVVEAALSSWLAAVRGVQHEPLCGFQWKQLFLPEGTELRMTYRGCHATAKVVGNCVLYKATPMTPNRFAAEVAGSARNAWRDLSLRLPGQRYWKSAAMVRSEQLRKPWPEASPAFQMHDPATAPAVMAQSLRNALALIEKASSRRHGKMERRTDILPDD